MSLGSTIGNAYIAIKPKADKSFSKDLEGMGGEAGGLAGTLFNGKFGAALTKLPGILKGLGIGVSLGKFVKDSIDVGKAFDQSMSQVAATMGTTMEELEKGVYTVDGFTGNLRDFALEMGSTTQFSAQQAADGLNILAQSGLTAEEQMAALPDVLNLAAAGTLDLGTAAGYVTGIVKGFGDSFENASKYTDMLAVGATKVNTDVNMLGTALSTAAASSASYGQSAESTTVSLMRLAEQGVTGSEAANALNRAMMDLYTPTAGAKKALDELGVSAYDLATGEARDLNDVIDDLNAALAGMSAEEANATKNAIFSTFGLQAFNKMTVTSTDKVGEFRDALENANGAAADMANTMVDNLAGDMTMMQSALEGLQIKVSDVVTPALRSLVQFAQGALSGISGFISEHQAVFDTLSRILGGTLSVALGIVQRGFDALGAVLNAVFNILKPIVPVINAFIDVLGYAYNAISSFVAPVKEMFSGLGETTTGIFDSMAEVISKDMEVASEAGKAAVDGLVAFMSGDFEIAHEKAKEAFDLIKGLIQEKLEAAKEIVISIADKIGEKLGFPGLGDKVRVLFMALEKFIEDPVGTAKEFVHTAIEKIKGMFNFQWSLPHLKLPHIVVGSYIDVPVLGRIPNPATLHVEWYKKGGIVDSPTLFGAGEAGPEAIVPLTAPNVIPFAEAVADRIGGHGDTFVFNITADSETTLQSLVREAQRARMQYA